MICYAEVVSPENPIPTPEKSNPFGFTEHEQLWDRISHKRFLSILEDDQTTIHKIETDSNTFGEFQFVTTSRASGERHTYITFWGLGFHDYRERWITDYWRWYESDAYRVTADQTLTPDEAKVRIQEREAEIAAHIDREPQSERGKLFEMLADLTDEDGAWAELDDLEGLLGDEDEW